MTDQMPTREQIAEALYLDDADHEDWSWATEDNSLTRAAYLKNADAVLALFPQPEPNAESKTQPEPNAESRPGVSTCYDPTPHRAHRWDRGIGDEPDITWVPLRCDGVPAEPVSIADMAPGTTFTARLNEDWCSRPHHQWTVRSGDVVWCASEGFGVRTGRIDPSTIRDVTPPTTTPGSES